MNASRVLRQLPRLTTLPLRRAPAVAASPPRHALSRCALLARHAQQLPRPRPFATTSATRSEPPSSSPFAPSATPSAQQPEAQDGKQDQPAYQMTFTCKKCSTRSAHRVSKQGYHKGTVLIQCPGCKVRHLISDHLKIFLDEGATLEDLLAKKGHLVKKGTLSEDGDVELWNDGTQNHHQKPTSNEPPKSS